MFADIASIDVSARARNFNDDAAAANDTDAATNDDAADEWQCKCLHSSATIALYSEW